MSLITSIFNGIQARNAAKDAAAAQQAGALQAGQTVNTAVGQVNPLIASAADKASEGVNNAAGDASSRVINTANDAARDARNAAADASAKITGAAGAAKTGVDEATGKANALLDPYSKLGSEAATSLSSLMAPGGGLTKQFTADDLQNDPGFQVRMKEGQQALERSAAARGLTGGGGQLKALTRYGQEQGSKEFGIAADRFQRSQDATFSRLSDLSKTGLAAGSAAGTNLTKAATYGGDVVLGGEKTAGDLTTDAAKYSGTTLDRASEVSGAYGTDAARTVAGIGTRSAEVQGKNTLDGADFLAKTQLGAADAKAQGDLGAAKAWGGLLNGVGSVADTALTGGYDDAGTSLSKLFGKKKG